MVAAVWSGTYFLMSTLNKIILVSVALLKTPSEITPPLKIWVPIQVEAHWAWSILPILRANALHKSSIDSLSICHTLCCFKPWFWSLLRNSLFEFQELPRKWKDFTKTSWKNHFLEKVKSPIFRRNVLYFLLPFNDWDQ